MKSLEVSAKETIERTIRNLPRERLLNALAHKHFRSLVNEGHRWVLHHYSYDGQSFAEIADKHLDRLMDAWESLTEEFSVYIQDAEDGRA